MGLIKDSKLRVYNTFKYSLWFDKHPLTVARKALEQYNEHPLFPRRNTQPDGNKVHLHFFKLFTLNSRNGT